LKGQTFADLSGIQRSVKTFLQRIQEKDFQGIIRQWQHRLSKCTAS